MTHIGDEKATPVMGQTDVRALLETGATLPAGWYSDPEIARLERAAVFERSWQYAGRADLVSEPGSYLAARAGHVPVVVVRDGDGELRAFVNVCRHRGHVVVEGAGRRETLQCPYHAWTYGLDGCLRAAPRSQREPGFDFADYPLLPVVVDTWGPCVFVNPDTEAAPLADVIAPLTEAVAASGLDVDSLRFHSHAEYDIAANWKITVENYLECYHCPVAHPGFSAVVDIDPDAYALRTFEWSSTQRGPVKPAALGGNGKRPYDPTGEIDASNSVFVWPNFTLDVIPGPHNLTVGAFLPAGPERTLGIVDYYFGADVDEKTAADMIAFAEQVGAEDNSLVEGVQAGLGSGMVPNGRLLPESEQLIAHFQRLVFDALAPS
jgi:phenylpropionate dioxygenase-like ring-hydroxylating dioxygenase large terminal subunit